MAAAQTRGFKLFVSFSFSFIVNMLSNGALRRSEPQSAVRHRRSCRLSFPSIRGSGVLADRGPPPGPPSPSLNGGWQGTGVQSGRVRRTCSACWPSHVCGGGGRSAVSTEPSWHRLSALRWEAERAIFRDVVNTSVCVWGGWGVLRTSTSWFFIDQCH